MSQQYEESGSEINEYVKRCDTLMNIERDEKIKTMEYRADSKEILRSIAQYSVVQ